MRESLREPGQVHELRVLVPSLGWCHCLEGVFLELFGQASPWCVRVFSDHT